MEPLTTEQLSLIRTAIDYTRGTIGSSPISLTHSRENPGWSFIHRDRAHQSCAFLQRALEVLNPIKDRGNVGELWNALGNVSATVGPGGFIESEEKPGWVLAHSGRLESSRLFLKQASEQLISLRKENEIN